MSVIQNITIRRVLCVVAAAVSSISMYSQKSLAEDATAPTQIVTPKKIKYRSGKTVNLDQKDIDGKLRRPDMSVITGAEQKADDGILRLRTDFMDRIAVAAGGEVQ